MSLHLQSPPWARAIPGEVHHYSLFKFSYQIESLQTETTSIKIAITNNEMSKPEPQPKRFHQGPASAKPKAESRGVDDPKEAEKETRLVAPSKAETALLPAFRGLSPDRIYVPETRAECRKAVDEILAAGIGGFDTEAKPIFRRGQKCNGPHVVQFALTDKAFIFQLYRSECEEAASDLIASQDVLKVGCGLKNDRGQIQNRLGITLTHVLDLDQIFRKMGYRGQIGVRGAMGVLLDQCFKKSKAITTSNWALPQLNSNQLLYAANDAFAALKIMEALQVRGHLKK